MEPCITRLIDLRTDREEGLALGAELISRGELVAFPTETVYGLGADAFDPAAVRRIFEAKGRPGDNPLISHVSCAEEAGELCRMDERARVLAAAFWPGPLTLVLPKKPVVPDAVTAGLDTAAVRMPGNEYALELIRRSRRPIAAPSANASGKPSTTRAGHVMDDLSGKLPLVLDGGPCRLGLESTVLSLASDVPVVLRPGGVTPEMISAEIGEVRVTKSVLAPLADGEKAESPGMKYRHYAPKADVVMACGSSPREIASRARALYDGLEKDGKRPLILATAQTYCFYDKRKCDIIGDRSDPASLCAALFAALRNADAARAEAVILEELPSSEMGLAYMNRALRAAGFRVY